MKFADSVPFIRFCRHSSILPCPEPFVRSADHRLYFVDNGSGRLEIGNSAYPLMKGTLAYVPAGTRYRFSGSGLTGYLINFDYDSTRADHVSFFRPTTEDRFDSESLTGCRFPDDTAALCRPFVLEGALHYGGRIAELTQEYESGIAYCRISAGANFKILLCDVLREMESGSKTKEAVEIVLSYIRDHYAEPITNATLGAVVGYHSHYINKLMVTGTGTTLRQYLVKYRIRRACELLLGTEKSLEEIAAETGFGCASYFCTVFKAKKGVSPSAYRQRCTLNI